MLCCRPRRPVWICSLAVAAYAGLPAVWAGDARAQTFVGLNFTASSRPTDSGFIPPDTMGAVGVDHFVELINGRYSVYRKSDGARVQTSTLDGFWAAAGAPHAGSFSFDPRVLYDPFDQRWYALAVDNPRAANSFLLAVSKSADPTQGWTGFKIDSDSHDTHWADFPMLGMNGDAVVITGNMFPITSGSTHKSIVVVPKSDLLSAAPAMGNATLFEDVSTSLTGFSVQPAVDQDGGSLPLPLLSSSSSTTLKRSSIGGTPLAPTLVTAGGTISVSANSSPPNADQPGPKADVHAGGDTRFRSNAVLNNGELWAVHGVGIDGRAAARWYRIDASSNTVVESGTVSDPSLAFTYPSIAVNDLGDVVIGFSGTDPNTFVSTYAVVGRTSGGVTSFGAPFQTRAGVADYERLDTANRNRWGDYSATTVDPADPSIFWTIQEYVSAVDQWSTQVTEIVVPQPGEVRWKESADGDWTDGASWFGGAVPAGESHVILSRATSPGGGSYTVNLTVDASATIDRLSVRQGNVTLNLGLNTLHLTNASIDRPSLTIGEFGGSPRLRVTNGMIVSRNAMIASGPRTVGALVLDGATWVSTDNLWIGSDGTLEVLGGSSLSIAGTTRVAADGLLRSSAAAIGVGSLHMTGGRAELAPGGDRIILGTTLFMGPSDGTIELRDNAMILDYLSNTNSPLNTVRARISDAYAGGTWAGPGITSADADATQFAIGYAVSGEVYNTFPAMFLGYTIADETTLLVRFTRYGDTNLDGLVNLTDFSTLAAHFGRPPGEHWFSGDFNYDSLVNVIDFNLLAANFGLSARGSQVTPADWAALAAAVPEPALGGVAGALIAAVGARRMRRKSSKNVEFF